MSCTGNCGCCEHHEHEHESHDHDGHEHEHGIEAPDIVALAISLILVVISLFTDNNIDLWLLIAAALISGYETMIEAFRNLIKLRLDETILMTVAVVAAFFLGKYGEAAMVAILFKMGEMAEEIAVSRSRRSIRSLLDIRPETAVVVENGATREVSARSVEIGTEIVVRAGDRVPLDAVITEGSCDADCSALTGESEPRALGEGDEALSGMIIIGGAVRCKTIRTFEDSATSRIIEIAEHAPESKGAAEKLITRFARIYTPTVMILAVLLAVVPTVFFRQELQTWLYRALVFLVASCPCALVISVPLTYFAGVGRCSRAGLLLKGSRFIDVLAKADCAAFDKTGTLTSGEHRVSRVIAADGVDSGELLRLAAIAESFSAHPIARAIVRAAGEVDASGASNVRELPGIGVEADIDGAHILCGGARMLREKGIPAGDFDESGIYLVKDGALAGCIVTEDVPRAEAKAVVSELRALGMKHVVMLTGDERRKAEITAKLAGIGEVRAELMPEDKVKCVEELEKSGCCVYVGDGINDAPVLATADVGVAIGGGSGAAVESADAAMLTGDLSPLPEAIRIARRTRLTANVNIVFALAVKAAVLLLGALGIAPMWLAMFADVGVMAILVLNASTVLIYRNGAKRAV